MTTKPPPLYLDTCAIIEAHRAGCWRALCARFELHTVQECRKELEGGDPSDPDYIPVDLPQIDATVTIHAPTQQQRVAAALRSGTINKVDSGERDLLTWCAAHDPRALILSTGDRAAIVAACELGLSESLKSLEEIASSAGQRPTLQGHYKNQWLSEIRTQWTLEHL